MFIETLGRKHEISKNTWTVIAGPCSAENEDQIQKTAQNIAHLQAEVFRAGIWKPRTKVDSWQGIGNEALKWIENAKRETGIAIATEVKDPRTIELTLGVGFDILWIGSRNSTNYSLLEEIGRQTSDKKLPIILKRGMGSDLDDWLGAAEYIAKHNPNIILCERGIRGFPRQTRFVLDLQTAKLAQIETNLPVVIDVSHAAGRKDLIEPMALAAKAAGFNGLMIEVHPNPNMAMTDKQQQISLSDFEKLMKKLACIPLLP